MEQTGMSQQDFANRLGISPASLSSIFTGRTNPTNNHVIAIHKAFPDININWLMFGEGNMYENAASETIADGKNSPDGIADDGHGTLPRTPQTAAVQRPNHDLSGGTGASLFAQESVFESTASSVSRGVRSHAPRSESPMYGNVERTPVQTMINIDKRVPKIKEIRVFFDDGTYQTFAPTTKS